MTKTFRIYHADGKPENVEASTATYTRRKDGLKIKIGKRTISGARMLTEVLAKTEPEPPRKQVRDDDDEL